MLTLPLDESTILTVDWSVVPLEAAFMKPLIVGPVLPLPMMPCMHEG